MESLDTEWSNRNSKGDNRMKDMVYADVDKWLPHGLMRRSEKENDIFLVRGGQGAMGR
jgi:hypothetical protein